MKVIMKCVNIKLWDILGCFHYILNAPRMSLIDFFFKKWTYMYCPYSGISSLEIWKGVLVAYHGAFFPSLVHIYYILWQTA